MGTESLAEVLGAGYSLQSHQLLFQQGQKINSSTCTNITLSKEGPAIHWEEFSVYLQSSDASVVLSQPSVATVVVTDQDCEFTILWYCHLGHRGWVLLVLEIGPGVP